MDVSKSMDKKIGPLPVAGWVMIVGAGIAFAMYRKRAAATTTNIPSDQFMTDPTLGNIGALTNLMQALNGGGTGPAMSAITDNNQWIRKATDYLLGRGYATPLVDSALRKYVAGIALTREEQSAVSSALESLGSLPFPPPPPATTPTPGQPIPATRISSLADFAIRDFGSVGQSITHLSNEDLLNASNLTYKSFSETNDPGGWATIVGMKYGTKDPLIYLNEVARRYQAGQLPESSLTGQVGSWTSGQPAFRLSYDDLVNRINTVNNTRVA